MIEIENVQEIGAGTAIVGLVIAFMLYNKINKIEIAIQLLQILLNRFRMAPWPS